MSRMPCRRCATCAGNALRELHDEGWRLYADGKWRKLLTQEEGVRIANDIARGATAKRIEVETTAKGSEYFLLMGER